jgi:3-methyladenine DNA glycosylase Mpg
VYIRQLRDMKLSANIELFNNNVLDGYARLCGWILARAHAKASGKAVELAAYIGRSDRLCDALNAYAHSYADRVERDYDIFLDACRSGRLEARTDEDMTADYRV